MPIPPLHLGFRRSMKPTRHERVGDAHLKRPPDHIWVPTPSSDCYCSPTAKRTYRSVAQSIVQRTVLSPISNHGSPRAAAAPALTDGVRLTSEQPLKLELKPRHRPHRRPHREPSDAKPCRQRPTFRQAEAMTSPLFPWHLLRESINLTCCNDTTISAEARDDQEGENDDSLQVVVDDSRDGTRQQQPPRYIRYHHKPHCHDHGARSTPPNHEQGPFEFLWLARRIFYARVDELMCDVRKI
jgi:hypothetical protein